MSDHCCGHDHNHKHDHSGHKHTHAKMKKISRELPAEYEKITFKVQGMDCADEIAAIEHSLSDLSMVYKIEASLMASTVTVYAQNIESKDLIAKKINASGVKVVHKEASIQNPFYSTRALLVGLSGVFTLLGFLLENQLALGAFVLAVLTGGSLVFPKALRSLLKFRFDINLLMTFAVLGAFYIGEYAEGATVVFLFSFAELLEAFSVTKARKAIGEILNKAPEKVYVKRNNEIFEDVVGNIQIGDELLIKSGEKIGLDGVVIKGETYIDQSTITGESIPVLKKTGDSVFAGTLNTDGTIEVKVTSLFENSKLSQIISMIEEAQSKKSPSEKFVDNFARYYTPLMLLLSILVMVIPPLFFGGDWDLWIYRALVLLVIGCPCALVLSTPVAVVSGLTGLAKKGILVKGGIHLEDLSKVKTLFLDKTGTLTYGRPLVTKIINLSDKDENELIKLAMSIEYFSSHPLAVSIVDFGKSKGLGFYETQNYLAKSGFGATGNINGHNYFVGNLKLSNELKIHPDILVKNLEEIQNEPGSIVILGHAPHGTCQGEAMAIFVLKDRVREGIKETLASIKNEGVDSIVMLSGDNKDVAAQIAKEVGVDQFFGELLPDQKVAIIEKEKASKKVAMVGDGVNDAPSMALSDVGIAMGGVGAGATVEASDIVLMQDEIARLPDAFRLSKKTLKIIKFNIIFALVLKLIFLALSMMGYSSLWIAVLADTGASVFVIFNSLRLLLDEKKN